MASIKFDNTELITTSNFPRFVKHESDPERDITSLTLAREDGEAFIDERYGIKKITLQGVIIGATQTALETAIDTMKELMSRVEKNLDIVYAGGTRRYVATCSNLEFDRDHFHILFCPWTAEFTILSGEGKDTADTTPLNEHSVTTTTPGTDSFTMAGTKPGRPVITLKGANWPSGVRGVEYENTDTGEKIIITRNSSWNNDDQIIIDCDQKKISDDCGGLVSLAVDGKFYGVFPKFKIGTNNIKITVGGITIQKTLEANADDVSGDLIIDDDTDMMAQSFSVPYADSTFKGIIMALKKAGTPGNMTIRIETDDGGKPSGTLADANATFTIAAADIGTSRAYITKYSTNLWGLSGNTKYWIVISGASLSAGNEFGAAMTLAAGKYPGGSVKYTTDGGSTWTPQSATSSLVFKILYGGAVGASTVKHTVAYKKTYL
jgi:hypothetical protein